MLQIWHFEWSLSVQILFEWVLFRNCLNCDIIFVRFPYNLLFLPLFALRFDCRFVIDFFQSTTSIFICCIYSGEIEIYFCGIRYHSVRKSYVQFPSLEHHDDIEFSFVHPSKISIHTLCRFTILTSVCNQRFWQILKKIFKRHFDSTTLNPFLKLSRENFFFFAFYSFKSYSSRNFCYATFSFDLFRALMAAKKKKIFQR